MSKPSIVVVGSSNTDMIIRLSRIPAPGETVLGGEFFTAPGGKGANQAVAAARAGGAVAFIASVGQDSLGDEAVRGFELEGIDVRFVQRDEEAASGVALIFVAEDGENSIAVASGANGRLSPDDLSLSHDVVTSATCVLTQLETPLATVLAVAEIARSAGVPVVLNPAPAQPLPDNLLRRVSILTPNEHEASLLTGVSVVDESSARLAASELLGRGVKTVIITLGARGALVATADAVEMVPSFPVKAIDTVAAGDVFNGALVVALGEQMPLSQAVRFASAAAAISVTRQGAQPSAPRREEIEALLRP